VIATSSEIKVETTTLAYTRLKAQKRFITIYNFTSFAHSNIEQMPALVTTLTARVTQRDILLKQHSLCKPSNNRVANVIGEKNYF
jgi:hypothetical protein